MKETNSATPIPKDQYGHAALDDAKTDPYGDLEFCVGSGDDFYCFGYAFFQWEGDTYCALHSVINSETGGFIQDGGYQVLRVQPLGEGELLGAAASMVYEALDWLCMGGDPIQHDKAGWNQDPYYFVRAVARACCRYGVEAERFVPFMRQPRRWRFGGAEINRQLEAFAPQLRGILPVSRVPVFPKSTSGT